MVFFATIREAEHYNPKKEIKHLIQRVAQKIEQAEAIPGELFEQKYGLGKELNELNKELEEENFSILSENDILLSALRKVKEKRGIFSFKDEKNEELKKRYKELVIEEQLKQVQEKMDEGKTKFEALAECGKELKNQEGSDFAKEIGEEIEKRLNELIQERTAGEIVQKIIQEKEEKSKLLSQYGEKLNKQGIEIGKKLGERVDELLEEVKKEKNNTELS